MSTVSDNEAWLYLENQTLRSELKFYRRQLEKLKWEDPRKEES